MGDRSRTWALFVLAALALSGCGASRAVALLERYRLARRDLVLPQKPPETLLSGEALVAANGALAYLQRQILADAPKGCANSPRAFDVAIWPAPNAEGWLVSIEQREDRCGRPGGPNMISYDWWEVYLVSSEGVVLARDSHPDNAGPPLAPSDSRPQVSPQQRP